jgi:hypothetical protein
LSLTFQEEHRLGVFENMVLRRIFGPLMEEVSADWRKLHNVELHDLYLSPNNMKMITPRKG